MSSENRHRTPISATSKMLLVQAATLIVLTVPFIFFTVVEARELRPSEHGLTYQSPFHSSDTNSSAAFFGSQEEISISPSKDAPESDPPPPALAAKLPLTTEKNKQEPRERKLEVAAIVCGGSGVALLLAGALVLVVNRFRREEGGESSTPSAKK